MMSEYLLAMFPSFYHSQHRTLLANISVNILFSGKLITTYIIIYFSQYTLHR